MLVRIYRYLDSDANGGFLSTLRGRPNKERQHHLNVDAVRGMNDQDRHFFSSLPPFATLARYKQDHPSCTEWFLPDNAMLASGLNDGGGLPYRPHGEIDEQYPLV